MGHYSRNEPADTTLGKCLVSKYIFTNRVLNGTWPLRERGTSCIEKCAAAQEKPPRPLPTQCVFTNKTFLDDAFSKAKRFSSISHSFKHNVS